MIRTHTHLDPTKVCQVEGHEAHRADDHVVAGEYIGELARLRNVADHDAQLVLWRHLVGMARDARDLMAPRKRFADDAGTCAARDTNDGDLHELLLLEALQLARTPRLVMVGGAGSLQTAAGGVLADSPNFPEVAKAEARAGAHKLKALREQTEVDWTFLSPSAVFAPGERTGSYRVGAEQLLTDAEGKSRISQEDYAIALLDEIESPRHRRARFTVGY